MLVVHAWLLELRERLTDHVSFGLNRAWRLHLIDHLVDLRITVPIEEASRLGSFLSRADLITALRAVLTRSEDGYEESKRS